MEKESNIQIDVKLDESNIPAHISWQASGNNNERKVAKAFLLSIFDDETRETLKIDLWTKDMQVQEMDRFFFYTFRSLTDTYFKATQNQELAGAMQQFTKYFGEKTGLLKPEDSQK